MHADSPHPSIHPSPSLTDEMLVNHARLSVAAVAGVPVTLESVQIGLRVRRGRHWRKTWRDDIDKEDVCIPKERMAGTVRGYTAHTGALVGRNSDRKHPHDRITCANGPGWCVVAWDTGRVSIYPIGAEGLLSLCAAYTGEDRRNGFRSTERSGL